LKADLKLDAVYLFGSYARGDASPDSDIDVMVVSPDFAEDVIENQMLLLRVRRKIDLRIEPHPIRSEELDTQHPVQPSSRRSPEGSLAD
jgi:predicted nucleotidyltransferase